MPVIFLAAECEMQNERLFALQIQAHLLDLFAVVIELDMRKHLNVDPVVTPEERSS